MDNNDSVFFTSDLSGNRVRKDSLCLNVLGAVDELDALLGKSIDSSNNLRVEEFLKKVQRDLRDLMACVSSGFDDCSFNEEMVDRLKNETDEINCLSGEISSFIYQRGGSAAVNLFHARTVSRRSERLLVSYCLEGGFEENNFAKLCAEYLNSLSNLLFEYGRFLQE